MRGALACLCATLLVGCQRPPPPRADALPAGSTRIAPVAANRPPDQVVQVVTLLATTEVRGTPEPCGCQSDPLGDIARVATLLAEARSHGGALLVDAGGLRSKIMAPSPMQQAQAAMQADFLEQQWRDLGAVVGVGDEDLFDGAERLPEGRLCANLAGVKAAPSTVRLVGGVAVGVFAVIDPALVETALERAHKRPGAPKARPPVPAASDPTAAARREVASLRAAGAQVVVGLLHMQRAAARKLVKEVTGVAVAVVGDDVGDDGAQAERVGETLLVQPADQGQWAVRVELHLRGGELSTELFAGAADRERELKRLDKKLEQVGRELGRLAADPQADPAFVATKRAEQDRLGAERDRLKAGPAQPPSGSYAMAELVGIRRRIPRDDKIAASMKALDARVGESNRKLAEGTPPPPPAKAEAHYVGIDDCESCHRKIVVEWRQTVHAKAWEELVKVNKQWSYDCISCHVTGYGRRGGSAMAHVENLADVQCEVCHGPGSDHSDEPKKRHLKNPTEALCKECHTPEHSDTFQFTAYLRDVLGPNHGQKRRASLGPGPTGHDLRSAALQKAQQK